MISILILHESLWKHTTNISMSNSANKVPQDKHVASIKHAQTVKDQSNSPPGHLALSCSGRFGGGRGRGTPRYCRSMELVGSSELNFIPTWKRTKKKSQWETNIYTILLDLLRFSVSVQGLTCNRLGKTVSIECNLSASAVVSWQNKQQCQPKAFLVDK